MKLGFSNLPPAIANEPNYISYVVQYDGDLESEAGLSNDSYITIINSRYAIITKKFNDPMNDRLSLDNVPFPSVVYVSRYDLYTVEYDFMDKLPPNEDSVDPLSISNINNVTSIEPLNLNGDGIIIGILDTGIDYMSREFINDDGTTRIISLWDQSAQPSDEDDEIYNVPFGRVYTSEDINRAIKESYNGGSPYDIVDSRDTIGHGTAMASLIGGNGKISGSEGAVPDAQFIVVKLKESLTTVDFISSKFPVYDLGSIMIGIEFMYRSVLTLNKPLVIYEPEGTTFGNHRSNSLLGDYEDSISTNIGIAIVNSVGNQGNAGNHVSGFIDEAGGIRDININVGEGQKFLRFEIWASRPDVMSLNVISPSGEITGVIPAFFKQKEINNFILEKTTVRIEYFLPEELSGDELIYVDFFFLQPGVWTFRLIGNQILNGRFDIWTLEKGMLEGGTSFVSPDSYGTIMTPSTNRYSISVANYNQSNFNIVITSGISFEDIRFNQVDLAAGGVNVKCVAPDNKIIYATGADVSAAVVSGAAAIMFQWGMVEGNNPYMYAQNLKSYLLKGTIKRRNDIYPNPRWGYGILNLAGVFNNL